MITITLNNVANLQDTTTAAGTINTNSATIVDAFETAVNTAGDQMQGALDMNSFQILNLPTPATAQSPLRLQDLNTFNGGGTIGNIPAGGITGQVLSKISNTDYATGWTSVPTLSGANTWSGVQTFVNSDIKLLGSSTGGTVFTSANSSASNFTLTFPAVTDTLVTLAASQNLTNKTLNSVTFTGTSGKTLTVNNSITLAGTDSTTFTFPGTSDTVVTLGATQTLTGKTFTTPTINGAALSGTLSGTPTFSGANFITYSNLPTVAANSFLGNSTTSTANTSAFTVGSLTLKASPTTSDLLLISDQAASGALKQVTIGTLPSGTASSITVGTTTINSGTTGDVLYDNAGALGNAAVNGGVTLTSGNLKLALSEAIYATTSAGQLAPTGTTSTTFVMMGMGSTVKLTPVYSSRIELTFTGYSTNSVATDGVNMRMYYGTGTAPANAVAATGTQVGSQVQATSATANAGVPFSLTTVITGLTPSTAYWFDMAIAAAIGGTATVTNVTATAVEF